MKRRKRKRREPPCEVAKRVVVLTLDNPRLRMRRWSREHEETLDAVAKRAGYNGASALSMLWSRGQVEEEAFLRLCEAMGVDAAWWSTPLPSWRRPSRKKRGFAHIAESIAEGLAQPARDRQ